MTHCQLMSPSHAPYTMQRLMEDDADMLRMCLTEQLQQQQKQQLQRRLSPEHSMVQGASGLFNTSSVTPTPPIALPALGSLEPQRGPYGWSASGNGDK